MPANSATVVAALATKSSSMTQAVGATPNRSRIMSDSPLPVTVPIRATISWIAARQIAVTIKSQSRSYPNCEPASA